MLCCAHTLILINLTWCVLFPVHALCGWSLEGCAAVAISGQVSQAHTPERATERNLKSGFRSVYCDKHPKQLPTSLVLDVALIDKASCGLSVQRVAQQTTYYLTLPAIHADTLSGSLRGCLFVCFPVTPSLPCAKNSSHLPTGTSHSYKASLYIRPAAPSHSPSCDTSILTLWTGNNRPSVNIPYHLSRRTVRPLDLLLYIFTTGDRQS